MFSCVASAVVPTDWVARASLSLMDLDALVQAEFGRLVRAVAVLTDSNAVAEDLVAEAFARLWERTQQGHRIDYPAGWVATTAMNLARSGLRRRGAARRAERFQSAGAALSAPPDGLSIEVRQLIAALPRRQRECVVLHYLLGYPVAVTAALAGVSEGTVKSALSRAREHLRTVLEAADA